MARYYVTHNATGFATGVTEVRKKPRISKSTATRMVLLGIIVMLLIALC